MIKENVRQGKNVELDHQHISKSSDYRKKVSTQQIVTKITAPVLEEINCAADAGSSFRNS